MIHLLRCGVGGVRTTRAESATGDSVMRATMAMVLALAFAIVPATAAPPGKRTKTDFSSTEHILRWINAYRLKPGTKVGLWKGAGNMPGGWAMWMLEQYGINRDIVRAQDFSGDLNAKYDVILMPSGTTKTRVINGLDPKRNDAAEWSWAFGVGEDGKPLVVFDAPRAAMPRQDIILERCYRNSRPVLATAHALGFGIYREPGGLIQAIQVGGSHRRYRG